MALADEIVSGAQQTARDSGNSVGHALSAYHIASTVENARKELDMEKDNHEMNKANFVISNLANIGKLPPQAQKIAMDGFTKNLQQIYPGANPDVVTALQKDQELQKNAFMASYHSMSNGAIKTPEEAQNVAALFHGDIPAMSQYLEHLGQQRAMENSAYLKGNQTGAIVDQRKDARDRMEHQKILDKMSNDPQLKARATQYTNLQNALATITQAKDLTPQQIFEFQQAVRSNLGIKGSGGVGEREQTYMNSLGLKAATWKQFLTGDPEKLAKDSGMMNHFKDLANVEMNNIDTQMDSRLNAVASGHGTMYSRRPDLQQDMETSKMNYVKALRGNGGGGGDSAPAPAAAPAGGGGMAVGTVKVGKGGVSYTFKGGDPQDKNNWEKR